MRLLFVLSVASIASQIPRIAALSIPSRKTQKSLYALSAQDSSQCEQEFNGLLGTRQLAVGRRSALTGLVAAASSLVVTPTLPALATPGIPSPNPMYITSLVLNKGESAGAQLNDVELCLGGITTTYATVKDVVANGAAMSANVQPGMILLGNYQNGAASVAARIKDGPFPAVLQFYNLKGEAAFSDAKSAEEALSAAKVMTAQLKARPPAKEPQVSAKGTGLVVKTVSKGTCTNKARKGDILTLKYEARVASPGGPLYDSGTGDLVLGKGNVVKGVELGLQEMCLGEVRELDVPSALGYGKYGDADFDIPGDVRLWWKAELLKLNRVEK